MMDRNRLEWLRTIADSGRKTVAMQFFDEAVTELERRFAADRQKGQGAGALFPAMHRCKRLKPNKEIVDGCGAQFTLEQLGGSSKCSCGGFFRKVEP